MPAKKYTALDYYAEQALYGYKSPLANNPAVNRERLIQANIQRNIGELAVNRFKWTGLPESCDPRFIETTLLRNGLVVFYWDDDFDKLLAVNASPTGYVNFMEWPVAYTVIGPGSKISPSAGNTTFMPKQLSGFIPFARKTNKEDEKRQAFPVWPNYFRVPELDTIHIYASRLATTDVTLEINTENARQTKYATSTQNNQLSMVNLVRQLDEGVRLIQPKDGGVLENIGVIDLGADPDIFDKLSILRTRWWNECMGLLGIDNANQDKKERLVAAEVGANDKQTDSMRHVALNARKQAVEYINDVFGTEIKVEFNVEVEEMARVMAVNSGVDNADKTNKDAE
jgi:hypothetical protein